jgi:hypothetical protein
MPVIEAQRASILVPHDHRHINHESASGARHIRHPGRKVKPNKKPFMALMRRTG